MTNSNMDEYRSLTEEEIKILQRQGCWAEDWTAVGVTEDFTPEYVWDTWFYGEVNLGVFEKNIVVDENFSRHSGLFHVILKDVTVGDNCLIEQVGQFIHNYDIGDECYISHVGKLSSTADATYGEGNVISVRVEAGEGNMILFDTLNAQLAAFMLRHSEDLTFKETFIALIREYIKDRKPVRGTIGYRVKITNTTELTNTLVSDECEISGASRISESSILSSPEASTYIGNDVILDNSIVQAGSSLLDGASVDNSFVGEACHVGKGASVASSLFFANSYIDNGEICSAFCGPFTVSHHKSSLLIGGEYAFYNAGSGTNFSNHVYKMGPIHWGTLGRGAKTASDTYILWPATIGAFTMCMGKIQTHPSIKNLPFSYLFGDEDGTYLFPGRNLMTVGTYRDIHKWPRRDMRPHKERQSLVNFDWLSPFVAQKCFQGLKILKNLRAEQGENATSFTYGGCIIRNGALQKGIRAYDLALRLFIGNELQHHPLELPENSIGTGKWLDLSGLLVPETEEEQLLEEIKVGTENDLEFILDRFRDMHHHYEAYKWAWTYRLILDRESIDTLGTDDVQRLLQEGEQARQEWLKAIRNDAEKEFQLGDVEETKLKDFLDGMEN